MEDWDTDADHELVVYVGPAEAATQKRDKLEIALKPSEMKSYRVSHLLVDWVGLTGILSVPNSAWADGNMAEASGQDGGTPESKSMWNGIQQ